MGKAILYLFFAIMLSATVALLVMLFGPVLYVEAMRVTRVLPSDVRVAAYFSLSIFVIILVTISFAIPRTALSGTKQFLFFIAMPCMVTWMFPRLGVSYFATLVTLAVIAVPACYQVIVSHRKAARR